MAHTVGPPLTRFDDHIGAAHERACRHHTFGRRPSPRWRHLPGAHRTLPTWRRRRVVEGLLQVGHEAPLPMRVAAHQLRLGGTHLRQRLPLRCVVHIHLTRGRPCGAGLGDHTLDRQDLQQCLEPATAHTGDAFDLEQTLRPLGQHLQYRVGSSRVGHRGSGEVLPQSLVALRWQQHCFSARQPPPGAPHLLVVGHRGGRRAHVQAEAEIGFVVPHAQRRGGHHGLHPVVA